MVNMSNMMGIPREDFNENTFNNEMAAMQTKQSEQYLNMLDVFATQKQIDCKEESISSMLREMSERNKEIESN